MFSHSWTVSCFHNGRQSRHRNVALDVLQYIHQWKACQALLCGFSGYFFYFPDKLSPFSTKIVEKFAFSHDFSNNQPFLRSDCLECSRTSIVRADQKNSIQES